LYLLSLHFFLIEVILAKSVWVDVSRIAPYARDWLPEGPRHKMIDGRF
jgi:hypothetical protein